MNMHFKYKVNFNFMLILKSLHTKDVKIKLKSPKQCEIATYWKWIMLSKNVTQKKLYIYIYSALAHRQIQLDILTDMYYNDL